ncbi:MAG: EAL domain-containing protein [Clostridia bacterium]|nr:EAL domain-containing protein [Clostridia bacterium]
MNKRNNIQKIEGKKYKLIIVFVLLLLTMTSIGFFYFQHFVQNFVWQKQVERIMSYTEHNASLAYTVLEGEKDIEGSKDLFYSEQGSVFVVDGKGNIINTIKSEISNKPNNIFNVMKSAKDDNKNLKTVKDVKASMLVGGDNGYANVNFSGEESILCYKQVKYNEGLYVVSILSSQQVITETQDVIVKVLSLVAAVIVGLMSVGFVYYRVDKRYNSTLRDLIYKDELIGHISYAKFLIEAEEVLKANPKKKFAIYYGDVKNFKYINDTFGYDVGDKFIVYISELMKESLGEDGIFARINADNFAVLRNYENREDFIEKIYIGLDKISEFPEFKKENYKPGVYVGVFCNEVLDKHESFSEMLDRANMAQKSIKGSHEFHLAFYNEEIRERIIAEKEIERKMETALDKGEFVVFYQPKYDVKSGEIIGAEALVRWNSPERGLMLPGKFIPLFEQNGFIVNLDQYVFETVCKTVREWIDKSKKVVSISINVSRVQFYRLDFVKRYTKIKNKYDIPDGLLELEFTESIVLENIELLQKIVTNLKANGFICSIDDFGSGYSSLNILKNLPMDILKLDRLFFKNSENTERDKALIASVVAMARALKMKTVSEGIETWNQVNFLKEIGCDIIQGYVYSEPISRNRFEHLVEGKKRKVLEPLKDDKTLNKGEVVNNNSDTTAKYLATLNFLYSAVVEIDYENDSFKIIKKGNLGSYENITFDGTEGAESFTKIIEMLVHPDDRSSLKDRCLPVGVLSSFYQGEKKIITDFRMLCENLTDYMWCRATIIRVESGSDSKFKSLLFVENIDEIISEGKGSLTTDKACEEYMFEMFSMIYEVNYHSDKFSLVYYNKELAGDRPENGEFSWFREQYLKKNTHPDDLVALQNFLSLQNVKDEMKSGKNKMLTQARLYVNDEIKYLSVAITLIRIPSKIDNELKVFSFCQSIDEINKNVKKTEEITKFVNNAICEYYDIVYLIDLVKDEITVIQAHHAFSKIPRITKYSKLVYKLIKRMVYVDDCDRVKEFMDPARVLTALKLGRAGNSCEFKRRELRNGQEIYHTVRATYIRIPSTDNKILFLVRDLGEVEKAIVASGADFDPLRELYKKESTEILINRTLDSIEMGETKAFILMDVSTVESLDDNNGWTFDTKDGILEEFYERVRDVLCETEFLCRTGGYEFIILSDKIHSGEELSKRANQLCGLLKDPLVVDGREYKVTGNIGISIYGVDGTNYEKLYMNADMALSNARFENYDSFSIYNGEN